METRNLKEGPEIKQYLSSISISQGNSNEVTIIIFTTEYLTGRLWTRASVISISFAKVSFSWRTPFPLVLYNCKLIYFSSHTSDCQVTRNSNYRRKSPIVTHCATRAAFYVIAIWSGFSQCHYDSWIATSLSISDIQRRFPIVLARFAYCNWSVALVT